MTQTVTVSRRIRRPVDDIGAFVLDPHWLLSSVSTFSRCKHVEDSSDGELWDVYLNSGTIYLGGRVVIGPADETRLRWQSVRGAPHEFEARVEADGADSLLTLTLRFKASGFGIGRISEFIGRGVVARNLEAAAEEIRHYLEFEQWR